MSTKIALKNLPQGYQTVISNGRHTIVGDEPIASKGTDLGFSPEDLLLAALGACKVSTVRFIARRNGWTIGNVDAELEMKSERQNGGMHTHVDVRIIIEGDLTEEQRLELLRQADRCYVHRVITGEWNIGSAVDATEIVQKHTAQS
jgi:putative redox protein